MVTLPFITVVVPAFNEEQEIPALLDSFLQLDWPEERLEILVVDNNSRDRTAQIVRTYPAPIRLLRELTPGPYAARNCAIRAARGEFIAFTDADCVVSPHWLSDLWAGFTGPTVGGVAGAIVPQTTSNFVDYFEGYVFKSPDHDRGQGTHPPYAVTANVMYRREVFDRVGLFQEQHFSGQDVELSWQVLKAGFTLHFLPGLRGLAYHRYRTNFAEFTRVLQRDAYGWYFLAQRYPELTTPPQPAKYLLKRLLAGLVVYPWTTLWRASRVLTGQSRPWEVPQDYMKLVVVWNHYLGIRAADRAHRNGAPLGLR
ncbi:glycosyltransferase family 2 protein [Candidatus Cyanaurora vandensis]|uniref:glycosyltransferase n=1 Tax=Candidatus Cyanaurora vandensis TaxID=2714958 RepID=UPI00257B6E02|nr:glycosyltransferase [Candidatus Cyanaurora vandensis]